MIRLVVRIQAPVHAAFEVVEERAAPTPDRGKDVVVLITVLRINPLVGIFLVQAKITNLFFIVTNSFVFGHVVLGLIPTEASTPAPPMGLVYTEQTLIDQTEPWDGTAPFQEAEMPVTELTHWPDLSYRAVIALDMFQGPLVLPGKAIGIRFPGMRTDGLTVACVVDGPFMGWAAVAVGLVIAA